MPLDGDHMARVGPAEQRKVWAGPEGMLLLVLGGAPGQVYSPPATSEIGGLDPRMP